MSHFEFLGWFVSVLSCWGFLLLCAVGLCRASNRVSYMVLDCYGGWKTFLEYRRWWQERNEGEQPWKP